MFNTRNHIGWNLQLFVTMKGVLVAGEGRLTTGTDLTSGCFMIADIRTLMVKLGLTRRQKL